MTDPKLTEASRFLSYVLRHEPEAIGLELDGQGWTSVEALIRQAAVGGKVLSVELIFLQQTHSPVDMIRIKSWVLPKKAKQPIPSIEDHFNV